MSLNRILPEPRHRDVFSGDSGLLGAQTFGPSIIGDVKRFVPPPYKKRTSFVPRKLEDFGEGGAFPEIHVAQYPLDMGRKDNRSKQVVALQSDASGSLRFDAVVLQGHRKDKIVHSRYEDIREKAFEGSELARPSDDDVVRIASETQKQLQKVLTTRAEMKNPTHGSESKDPEFIRYTSSNVAGVQSAGSTQRIIRMVEAQRDPLEPPRFQHAKVPRASGSPPAPVMHSPPRKPTQEDMNDWKIPPCISNWKNPRGYTISLDKRLVADGRGTQEIAINDKFAKFSESLYLADRNAREELERRTQIQKKLKQKEQEEKEQELRQLAQLARLERTKNQEPGNKEADDNEREDRDRLREERRRMREREHRHDKNQGRNREADRDVSEKVALGQSVGAGNAKELLYDQRLFNQSQGMDSGFGSEDGYNLYDKPLFQGSSANMLYRPNKVDSETYGGEEMFNELVKTDRFRPERGFEGADQQDKREGPVQFEHARTEDEDDDDPYGLETFMTKDKSKKRVHEEAYTRVRPEDQEDDSERSSKRRHR